MFASDYRRIYHYHLKKCAGTTLNHWLDTFTSDGHLFDPRWGYELFTDMRCETDEASHRSHVSRAKIFFHWSDVVHSHAPIRPYVPDDTFCLTVLRDPVQRLISQVTDWRRLKSGDASGETPFFQECIADAGRMPLRDYLERYRDGDSRFFLDNYLTRALASGRIGGVAQQIADAGRLSDIARHSIAGDYHLVGLAEDFDLSRNALCEMIGLPPIAQINRLNVSSSTQEMPAAEIEDAADILQALTHVDRTVYDSARQLFDTRHRAAAEAYDAAAFEERYAARVLRDAKGSNSSGATRYSVKAPLIGSGFHGRDSAGMPICAVWTGPGKYATLYVPVPPAMELTLLIWIRGYAEQGQRDRLRVQVDGEVQPHRFEPAENYADLLAVDISAKREFVHLQIEVDQPWADNGDPRKRGISFDSYGWRLR